MQRTYHQLYTGVATALTPQVRKLKSTRLKPGKKVQSTGKVQYASLDLASRLSGSSPASLWASILSVIIRGRLGWSALGFLKLPISGEWEGLGLQHSV